MKENTGEIDSKNVVKNRELLYRMIISQLYYDGFQPIAATLSAAVHADPPCPPSDRLLNLMMVGLQHEPDRKDRLAASSGAEHLLGTTGFDVQHVKGADNLVADAFSRVESVSAQDLLKSLAQSQASDEELISLQDSTSLRLTRVPVPGTNFELKIVELTGAEHRMTTSYHPQCNGMVERLHRQLKAAIMCHANPQWTEVLPFVLLGIRSSWKEDLGASCADLVYGEPLRLPGEFFNPTKDQCFDPTYFADRLRTHMAKLSPCPASRHGNKIFYVPKDLSTADFVFLRRGTIKKALQQPYMGPFKVLERSEKYFKIESKGKPISVTIDRLKPAFVLQPDQPELLSPAVTTRSGRRVRFTVPFQCK
ncbi:uncharacterized protein LOC112045684 isoform X4 [Bicyclus anynana]|uniref:Uncharacterized protein LOC112045684 isoform X4 n=1 Tax=Bicyclus anynana TaxID=110368 RepID=A0ABM3M396_BICAN|nr:uncharacterized protein LOC112045684 isoform X4 [Bicyclus anynana]